MAVADTLRDQLRDRDRDVCSKGSPTVCISCCCCFVSRAARSVSPMSQRKKAEVHMPSAAKSKAAAAKPGRKRNTEGHQQIVVDVEVNEVQTQADHGILEI